MPGRDYSEVFEKFRHLKVMVIGDVMVDAYIFGKVDRISPEAPVPVVTVDKRINRLGGAANVALNLKALGAFPVLCSVIGNDPKGIEFRQLLEQEGISGDDIITSNQRMTTTKFRVIGNKTQMLRVDEEMTEELDAEDEDKLMEVISGHLVSSSVDAVIFQDYDKGVITPALITQTIAKAKKMQIPVAVDPKRRHFLNFVGADLFKPNLKELREGLNREIPADSINLLKEAALYIHSHLEIRMMLTTLSEKGIFISQVDEYGNARQHFILAHVRNISDVSGAGDTVISVAALGLAAGLETEEIAALANLAGGLVCEEVGVVPVNRDRLLIEAVNLL